VDVVLRAKAGIIVQRISAPFVRAGMAQAAPDILVVDRAATPDHVIAVFRQRYPNIPLVALDISSADMTILTRQIPNAATLGLLAEIIGTTSETK